MEDVKRRDWCFTLNNYTEDEILQVNGIECKYLVYGKETGANGTPHLQGYIYFKNARKFSGVKSSFPQRTHLEAAIASAEKNIAYCKKGNQPKAEYELDGVKGLHYGEGADVFQKGEPPLSQKEKGDANTERYEEAKRAAMDGKLEDIPGDIFIKCYHSLCQIKKDYMEKPSDLDGVCGIWIYGLAGVGKSRKARAEYPGAYDKMCNKWWDGYQGEKFVLIDDFDKSHSVLGHHLKRWGDRYSFIAEKKGGAINVRPEKIIVTSQYAIDQIWDDQETRDAINRRYISVCLAQPYAELFNPPSVLGTRTASEAGLDEVYTFDDDDLMLLQELM